MFLLRRSKYLCTFFVVDHDGRKRLKELAHGGVKICHHLIGIPVAEEINISKVSSTKDQVHGATNAHGSGDDILWGKYHLITDLSRGEVDPCSDTRATDPVPVIAMQYGGNRTVRLCIGFAEGKGEVWCHVAGVSAVATAHGLALDAIILLDEYKKEKFSHYIWLGMMVPVGKGQGKWIRWYHISESE